MSNIEIHDAGPDDVPAIARIWVEANSARYDGGFEPAIADVRRLISERMSIHASRFFIARMATHLVAIGHFLPARENDGSGLLIPGLMHLSMIAVVPNAWGRGIGKLITEFCVGEAARLGYESIQLWTQSSNDRAQRLYASAGFKETGRVKIDEHGERIRLYSLRLT